ncbi:MAG: PEP/pyruvate-binding domain-containing protein [Dermatophilaceae bacterium]
MTYVLDLAEDPADAVALVGGKAVNLGVMLRAGLPVPAGFSVVTDAYRQAAQAAVAPFMSDLRNVDIRDVAPVASAVRDSVSRVVVPVAIASEVTAAHRRLGADRPVAVRSSATAEDLPHASFAGQQDTYLNVIGAEALIAAVRRCWSSLWTERAIVYRRAHGIDPSDVALAVVVQDIVDATAAGVMFTANPVTGSRSQTVIDANHGLGESVVSGGVNPDRFVVTTASGEIVERTMGDKRLVIRASPGGGVVTQRRDAATDQWALTDRQVRELVALGARVTALYGEPQDTEWALDRDGGWWLTQARPITTLFPLPVPHRPGHHVYLCASLAQGLTRPITPLGRGAVRLLSAGVSRGLGIEVPDARVGASAYAEAGGRIFLDLTAALRHPVGRRLSYFVLDYMEARTAAALRAVAAQDGIQLDSARPWRNLHRLGLLIARAGIPRRIARSLIDPDWAVTTTHRIISEARRSIDLPSDARSLERLDAVEHALSSRFLAVMPGALGCAAGGFISLALARRLLGKHAGPGDLQTVMRGLPHNVTIDMDLELWGLSRRVAHDASSRVCLRTLSGAALTARYVAGALPAVLQRGLADFLDTWGDRAVAEMDLGMPRWSTDPTQLFSALANYAQVDDQDQGALAQFAKSARDAEEMVNTLVAREPNPLRSLVIGWCLDRTRRLAGLRESPKFGLISLLGAAWRQLEQIGADLVDDGLIDSLDDLAFLDFVDIRRAVHGQDVRTVAISNRAAYDVERGRRHIPRLLLGDGTELEAQRPTGARPDDALMGTPASAGSVTGRARIILDPVGAQLEPGDILVVPSTDPGWTPLFLTAGGLVMEMGGSNSHGAVVAREYGIPAVVGVPNAARVISTGQVITVDGSAGLVHAAESGDELIGVMTPVPNPA